MMRMALVPFFSWNASSSLKAGKSTVPSLLNGVINATKDPVINVLVFIGAAPSPRFLYSYDNYSPASPRAQLVG